MQMREKDSIDLPACDRKLREPLGCATADIELQQNITAIIRNVAIPDQRTWTRQGIVECTSTSAPAASASTVSEVEVSLGGERLLLPASPPITTLPAGVSTR